MSRLIFSGHESFTCKQFWLKKGFDFLREGKKFSDASAVVDLGVGKNMVRSIRYWLLAFRIMNQDGSISKLGEYLFGEKGKDPFLEDVGSIWLLHYHLVASGHASIYNLVFNEFRKTRQEFRKEQLHNFLKIRCLDNKSTVYNTNTIDRDIRVLVNSYIKPKRKRTEIEDAFSGLLQELNLLDFTRKSDISSNEQVDWYFFESNRKEGLPYQIMLYSILDNPLFGSTISFKDLQISENSPGRIFAINADGIYAKIQDFSENLRSISYSETAGNRILQINSEINKWDILDEYYK